MQCVHVIIYVCIKYDHFETVTYKAVALNVAVPKHVTKRTKIQVAV